MKSYDILPHEIAYLRELAKKQLDYANKPVMERRVTEWTAHNRCQGSRPMIIMELDSFWPDVKPAPFCRSKAACWLEDQLQRNIFIYEQIGDDHVTPNFITVPLHIDFIPFGLEQQRQYAEDGIGFHITPVLNDLSHVVESLPDSGFLYHEAETQALVRFVGEITGDILQPRVEHGKLLDFWDNSNGDQSDGNGKYVCGNDGRTGCVPFLSASDYRRSESLSSLAGA